MTDSEQRKNILTLLDEAQKSGARLVLACAQIGLSKRTNQHWREAKNQGIDRRTLRHHSPPNKLSESELSHLLAVANSPEYGHLPPSQIIPRLADNGLFLASESTLYRALRAAGQLTHRRLERPAQERAKPRHISVFAPDQCFTWDITYLPSWIRGQYFYLYMPVDIFSRKIVGWEVHENESSEHASALLRAICARENIHPGQLSLHSDNGAPMKGSSLLATMQQLGVAASLSRPSCSNDNPYIESAFGTLKYRPDMPLKPFAN
jgi:putative transposase